MAMRFTGEVCSWLAIMLVAPLMACSQPKPEPEIGSSAGQPLYAASYPEHVEATGTAFGEGQVKVKELSGEFDKYPGELEGEDVDYGAVAEMFERADETGRSRAYVEGREEIMATARFYEEEREEIRAKVSGAAQYMAKQKGCEAEVGPAAAAALDKIMEERLKERLRESNDAHRMLERHRDTLGKENAAKLEEQLDDVSRASYLAFIELVEHKVRLRRMIEEAERVKKTADEHIDREQAYQNESGRSDEEKAAAGERIEKMKAAKAAMDKAIKSAERTSQDMEKRIEDTQKQYKKALEKLLESLRSKAKKK